MSRLEVDLDIFERLHKLLNLRHNVQLQLTEEMPKQLLDHIFDSVAEGGPAEDLIRENLDAMMGCYTPICGGSEDNPVIELHFVWVKATLSPHQASVSFIHELVHAQQAERWGVLQAKEMGDQFIEMFGYEDSPIEVEAESRAQLLATAMRPKSIIKSIIPPT